MKVASSFLLLVFFAFASNAQPDGYIGKAQITIIAFWDGAAKLEKSIEGGGSSIDADKLSNLQRKIDETKRKDPSYNTATMEAKVKILVQGIEALKKKNETAIKGNRDKTLNIQKVDQLLRSLFHISTDVDNGALKTIKEVIENYKKRTTEMLAMDKSTNKGDLEKYIVSLKNDFKSGENDLYELDRRCREQTVAENAEVQYYELIYKQAYWDAAQKLYPDVPEFAKVYATATKLLDGLGTIDDVHNLASKSKQQKINETKLPAAVMKDVALEKMFIDAFNKQYSEEFKGTATKAVLLSDNWTILRHEITGIATGRRRHAAIIYKGTNGKCYLTSNFFIHQDYVGNSFINTKSIYVVMGSQEMLCANVK
jgi:hypothetical protein